MTNRPFRIVMALYPGVTQLDFTAPHQVFIHMPNVEIIVASVDGGALASDSGLVFAGTTRLADIETCDLIFAPGGVGCTAALADTAYLAELRRLARDAHYVTSVCTGSLLLGAAGLLEGRRAASHWASRHLLAAFGAIPDDRRVVRDGRFITGGGVTAGLDFALTVAAELHGDLVAQRIQLSVEYAPAPPFHSGRPDTAPSEVRALLEAWRTGMLALRGPAVDAAAARLGSSQPVSSSS